MTHQERIEAEYARRQAKRGALPRQRAEAATPKLRPQLQRPAPAEAPEE